MTQTWCIQYKRGWCIRQNHKNKTACGKQAKTSAATQYRMPTCAKCLRKMSQSGTIGDN